jgi:hypothetical protein
MPDIKLAAPDAIKMLRSKYPSLGSKTDYEVADAIKGILAKKGYDAEKYLPDLVTTEKATLQKQQEVKQAERTNEINRTMTGSPDEPAPWDRAIMGTADNPSGITKAVLRVKRPDLMNDTVQDDAFGQGATRPMTSFEKLKDTLTTNPFQMGNLSTDKELSKYTNPVDQFVMGGLKGAGNIFDNVVTPTNAAVAAGTLGIGGLAAPAKAIVQPLAKTYFASQILPQAVGEGMNALDSENLADFSNHAVGAVGNAAMGVGLVRSAAGPETKFSKNRGERAIDNLAAAGTKPVDYIDSFERNRNAVRLGLADQLGKEATVENLQNPGIQLSGRKMPVSKPNEKIDFKDSVGWYSRFKGSLDDYYNNVVAPLEKPLLNNIIDKGKLNQSAAGLNFDPKTDPSSKRSAHETAYNDVKILIDNAETLNDLVNLREKYNKVDAKRDLYEAAKTDKTAAATLELLKAVRETIRDQVANDWGANNPGANLNTQKVYQNLTDMIDYRDNLKDFASKEAFENQVNANRSVPSKAAASAARFVGWGAKHALGYSLRDAMAKNDMSFMEQSLRRAPGLINRGSFGVKIPGTNLNSSLFPKSKGANAIEAPQWKVNPPLSGSVGSRPVSGLLSANNPTTVNGKTVTPMGGKVQDQIPSKEQKRIGTTDPDIKEGEFEDIDDVTKFLNDNSIKTERIEGNEPKQLQESNSNTEKSFVKTKVPKQESLTHKGKSVTKIATTDQGEMWNVNVIDHNGKEVEATFTVPKGENLKEGLNKRLEKWGTKLDEPSQGGNPETGKIESETKQEKPIVGGSGAQGSIEIPRTGEPSANRTEPNQEAKNAIKADVKKPTFKIVDPNQEAAAIELINKMGKYKVKKYTGTDINKSPFKYQVEDDGGNIIGKSSDLVSSLKLAHDANKRGLPNTEIPESDIKGVIPKSSSSKKLNMGEQEGDKSFSSLKVGKPKKFSARVNRPYSA